MNLFFFGVLFCGGFKQTFLVLKMRRREFAPFADLKLEVERTSRRFAVLFFLLFIIVILFIYLLIYLFTYLFTYFVLSKFNLIFF
jgi:cell division septal protein FtsQ